MRIKMELKSDVIFGNGNSVPGAEDISVLRDEHGFPYYKGSTFKGIFREEIERYMELSGITKPEIENEIMRLLGMGGDNIDSEKMVFSDFTLSDYVKQSVLDEVGSKNPEAVLELFTNLRTFTSINEDGIVEEGSLRIARCVNKGIILYSNIECMEKDVDLIINVIESIKWIGTKRNRGFGKVKFTVCKESEE